MLAGIMSLGLIRLDIKEGLRKRGSPKVGLISDAIINMHRIKWVYLGRSLFHTNLTIVLSFPVNVIIIKLLPSIQSPAHLKPISHL
jgi:hypothetical protein